MDDSNELDIEITKEFFDKANLEKDVASYNEWKT